MEAIETLMNEHRLIERVCAALASFAEEARRGRTDGRAELDRFVTFAREFADARHHAKEEDFLFAAMADAGFPTEGGPVAVMLAEHDQGRALVRSLAELAGRPAAWTAPDRDALAAAARAYADLLCAHIQKEDRILYPMAQRLLPPDLQDRVDADCRAYQAREIEAGEYQRLFRLGEDLIARHAPPRGVDAPSSAPAGHDLPRTA